MPDPEMARAWVEVDLDALCENYRAVRHSAGPAAAVIAMVKADAYGLGAARVVRALEPLQPWGYGVATADEGVTLRELGVQRPVVVFGPLPPGAVERAAAAGLVATISDIDGLDRWAAAARRHGSLDFQIEIDTGMGRAGFDWRDTPAWSDAVRQRCGPALRWTGAYTHFQDADGPDEATTALQWQRLQDALAQLPVPRDRLMVHAANSAAAMRWPAYAADAVRPGIYLYGGSVPGAPPPRPVAAVRARLVLVREVPPGTTTGYGATHVARGRERWGTVAVGYGDGVPRRLGNVAQALVRGQRVPLVGRISMDMAVVDISGVPAAEVDDVVTLIGSDGGEAITVDEVAAQAETISYEILTGLRPRLPRVEKG